MDINHPFFKGIDEKYLRDIAAQARIMQFGEGELLLKEGEDADRFYLVISGKVAIEIYVPNRGHITIQTVESGEILGWSWLVAPFKWRFDGRALQRTEVIAVNGLALREQCEKDPQLGYSLMKRIVKVFTARLEQTRLQLLDVYGARVK